MNQQLILEAGMKGLAWAESLHVGDVFIGAMPAAEAAYEKDSIGYHAFLSLAVAFMPERVELDDNNRIVKIGR